jgi:hypothetical protein
MEERKKKKISLHHPGSGRGKQSGNRNRILKIDVENRIIPFRFTGTND